MGPSQPLVTSPRPFLCNRNLEGTEFVKHRWTNGSIATAGRHRLARFSRFCAPIMSVAAVIARPECASAELMIISNNEKNSHGEESDGRNRKFGSFK
jgi:hypothetical protein